jgi:hypothetical protein
LSPDLTRPFLSYLLPSFLLLNRQTITFPFDHYPSFAFPHPVACFPPLALASARVRLHCFAPESLVWGSPRLIDQTSSVCIADLLSRSHSQLQRSFGIRSIAFVALGIVVCASPLSAVPSICSPASSSSAPLNNRTLFNTLLIAYIELVSKCFPPNSLSPFLSLSRPASQNSFKFRSLFMLFRRLLESYVT